MATRFKSEFIFISPERGSSFSADLRNKAGKVFRPTFSKPFLFNSEALAPTSDFLARIFLCVCSRED
jgi:hypothetical protein